MSAAAATTIHRAPQRPSLSLNDLAREPFEALKARYLAAPEPDSAGLEGRPLGRMLAVRYTRPIANALRRFAASPAFPWAGKTFARIDDSRGRGINRVRLGGRHRLFGFETRLEPSALDGRVCVALDYEQPQNPGFIQHIHDEIRAVAPGLYLGPAMWKGEEGRHTVLWFALDFNTPDLQPPFALEAQS